VSSGNGNITFGSTVDDNTASTQSLTVNSGTGTTTFSGVVGGTTALKDWSITADNLSVGGNVTGTGNFTITQYTGGTTIGVGTNATGTLNLSDTLLGRLLSYNLLTIGNTSSGAVDINTASSIGNQNLTVISGGTIYLDKSGDTSPQALTKS